MAATAAASSPAGPAPTTTTRSSCEAVGGSLFRIPDGAAREAAGSTLRQGFLEQANVTTSDEMISMMAAIRQAESGSRLVRTYDQLIGQAITTFSRRGS